MGFEKYMEKIFFDLDVVDGYPPVAVENLFGEKIYDKIYIIKNLPFYINDIAYEDKVSVNVIKNKLFFNDLFKESGRGLIRVVLFEKNFKESLIKKLNDLNLNWESIKGQEFYSIDIPNKNVFDNLVQFLEIYSELLDYQEAVIPNL